MTIHLADTTLFGNDAAEDEDDDVFQSYALDRAEVDQFLEQSRKICIARAYKGEGKSAVLRLVRNRLEAQHLPPVVVAVSARQIAPTLTIGNVDVWVREWKKALVGAVAREMGSKIQVDWHEDATLLVEEAENDRFKHRSFVRALLSRLKPRTLTIEQELEFESVSARYAERADAIWIIVDDADENFSNSSEHRVKVASFFIAARELVKLIPQFRMRLAVRPNTWTIIFPEYEALSKVEQYNTDLKWSKDSLRNLLALRIEGYLKRTAQWHDALREFRGPPSADQLIGLAFQSPVRWGGGDRLREVHVPLITLARRRPRWLVELAREAARSADLARRGKIELGDITQRLLELGRRRIADTVAEFSPQCPQVNELIQAFSRQPEEYATSELVGTISRRILQSISPTIVGIQKNPTPIQVAAFLFQIGFLSARRTLEDGEYEHISYTEQPDLLQTRTNLDDGVRWEIHPIFRQVLQMRDKTGRPVSRPKNGGRR